MPAKSLCINIRYLLSLSHGRSDIGEPEWPPSPLRLHQALVAAAAARWNERERLVSAVDSLRWLETLGPPSVVAGQGVRSTTPYRLYVPDNVGDKVANSWRIGNEADIASYRTEKDVRVTHLTDEAVRFLFRLPPDAAECDMHFNTLRTAARSITHLGWGVDMVVGDAELLDEDETRRLEGERWDPSPDGSGTPLRVPVAGTLDALIRRHESFLHRLSDEGFRPVPPLTVFKSVAFRRETDPVVRPHVIFQLVAPDGRPFAYPQSKLIHIHGMVRHLAIEAMQRSRPPGTDDDWVESYVRGKMKPSEVHHRQFSYIPLPSIGHLHVDPSIRRVMIAAPPGDARWLKFLCDRLLGQQLRPDPVNGPQLKTPPLLSRPQSPAVTRAYVRASNTWASVTPVILPGYDDRNPAKTRKLIEKALAQSAIEIPCEVEWRAVSWFPKSLSAHKHDKEGRMTGYIRPNHLLHQSAVHLRIRFANGFEFAGPLAIGAGRHCGLGLLAAHEA